MSAEEREVCHCGSYVDEHTTDSNHAPVAAAINIYEDERRTVRALRTELAIKVAEVARLTAELAQTQAAYDELCRVAGRNSSERYAYGLCPLCSAPGVARERRLGGNDRCSSGHTYPSSTAVHR
jgi:hypothetical protein